MEHELITKLRKYLEQIELLIDDIRKGIDVVDLKGRLKTIKESIGAEYKRCNTLREQAKMDKVESAFYWPVIGKVKPWLGQANLNSRPQTWLPNLEWIRVDLDDMIRQYED